MMYLGTQRWRRWLYDQLTNKMHETGALGPQEIRDIARNAPHDVAIEQPTMTKEEVVLLFNLWLRSERAEDEADDLYIHDDDPRLDGWE